MDNAAPLVIDVRCSDLPEVSAALSVLADRERELLELKGPCTNGRCRLHRAHSGPCNPAAKS